MFEIVEKDEKDRICQVLKTYNSKTIEPKYRVDLVIILWKKVNKKTLECRKMFYKEKHDEWVMGGPTGITIEELNIIAANFEDIKQQLLT